MNLGDLGNMKDLFGKMRDAQKHMKEIQSELQDMRVEAQTGAGIVTAIVDGEGKLIDIKIDTSLLEANEMAALPKLIVKAVQEAQKKSKSEAAEKAKAFTSGLNFPGFGS
ncbi:MAG: YbaB/EbfC family nucleoid-associated protein [Spirochaetia bacterium]|nr:YbaB/EbfC family nucleoid-associated protein [Spirochaetia bacterium]